MGNCLSFQISCDSLITGCWNCIAGKAAYVCQLKENLETLQTARDELMARKNDVMRRVTMAEGQQMKRLEEVELWLSRVETRIAEIDELIVGSPQEIEKLCLAGFCSRGYMSSYRHGKKVAKKLKDVNDLMGKGNFEVVAQSAAAGLVIERPTWPTVGLETMLDRVWSCLEEERVNTVGIYGMGGVGKTTLLTYINNKFLTAGHDFDIVVWVTVTRDFRPQKVQEEIGKRIGFSDEWNNKSLSDRSLDINSALRNKKFVLLLDDIWELLNLQTFGIPVPGLENGSKVVFTTRSEGVCCSMLPQASIKMEPLPSQQAWELFQKNVGEPALGIDPDIPALARAVAEKCSGLPLALINIGRAMARNKSLQEWTNAMEVLRKSSSHLRGMRDHVFTVLKSSYDGLPDNIHRSCFLYCTLFSEHFRISKDDLIDYWINEEFWNRIENEEDDRYEGYRIIGTLVGEGLLEDEGSYVKMHAVIRDMALWIGKESILVQADAQLTAAPEIEKWKEIKRMSLMKNSIENLVGVPTSTNLLTLFLCHNPLEVVSSAFFGFMERLTVLDLSSCSIKELPRGISKLVALQYLNLSHTQITALPLEMRMLVKLRYLNLERTIFLSIIPWQVISTFSLLEVLRMFRCGYFYEETKNIIEEMRFLKHLKVLSFTIRCASALNSFFSSPRMTSCTQVLSIESFSGSRSLDISTLAGMKHLCKLEISSNDDLMEMNADSVVESMANIFRERNLIKRHCFNSLQEVSVGNCSHLQDLTWLMLAPNLTFLRITVCESMKEIISTGRWDQTSDVVKNLNPFAKVEVIVLKHLPQLGSIHQKALPFPRLKKIQVFNCPKLRKLPLSSSSAQGCAISIQAEKSWWEELEWEDDATKATFLPCFADFNPWS